MTIISLEPNFNPDATDLTEEYLAKLENFAQDAYGLTEDLIGKMKVGFDDPDSAPDIEIDADNSITVDPALSAILPSSKRY